MRYQEWTPPNVDKYAKGIIGGNELTISRAKMFTEAEKELHYALKKAILYNLRKKNLLTENYKLYIDEASEFSMSRKFNFSNFKKEVNKEFSFDFVSASKKNFFCDPNLKRKENGKYLFKLYYDESSKDELDYAIKQWLCKGMNKSDIQNNNLTLNKIKNVLPDSQYLYNLGKFYHQVNMKVMKRSFLIKDQPITWMGKIIIPESDFISKYGQI